MEKNILKVDGRFYYGWIMLFCGFMTMFICYVIKANCTSLFYTPICEELGVTRTAYTQTNTILTVCMLIGSAFIGKVYKKFQVKYVLSACVALTCICYLGMSRATALWQFYMLSGIQGFGWAGATNLPVSIMVSNWFGPKIKGTAMSIGMLGSGAGALVWVNVISSVITNNGWRSAYLAMAGINAIMIPIALLLAVSYPSDKGFETRVGDPSPKEAAEAGGISTQKTGITGQQALKTSRWWFQWLAALVTMIGASALSSQCVAYFTDLTGDKAQAALIYSGALGTLVVGKFILGVISDVIHIKRSAVVAPLFYAGVFVCLALCSANMSFSKGMIAFYMIGGAIPSVIPALITVRNFGDKEFGVMNGWMNMAGNVGQIIGPTVAAFIFDVTGTYRLAWVAFACLMVVVSLLYLASNLSSRKQIAEMGYTPQ
ncbi:MFS transporter [Intestinimonas butyriciproducens]|uniref:MFS transporter n=1 Tax=Intestinimonas butyriciproducens TaxID=1297617 RepID=UPI0018A05473|nr:MFS transporter [Intestinimonas butyriciproducens]MDB7818158.1 MFS transporter [Intestinimonas butyriciproducens]MDB7844583.1 MFS transporter [Intestinimonas butyriciproducens]MDB7859063.1 MFS transporter [Intestinimonas butyriciproducens]